MASGAIYLALYSIFNRNTDLYYIAVDVLVYRKQEMLTAKGEEFLQYFKNTVTTTDTDSYAMGNFIPDLFFIGLYKLTKENMASNSPFQFGVSLTNNSVHY